MSEGHGTLRVAHDAAMAWGEALKCLGRERSGEEMSLSKGTAEFLQGDRLSEGLNSVGDHAHANISQQYGESMNESRGVV